MWNELTFLATSAIGGYVLCNINKITMFAVNMITLSPGTGRIYSRTCPKSKKKKVFVDTTIGKIKLPFFKLPSLDTDMYFFEDESAVGHSHIVPRAFFEENYNDKKFVPLKRYDMGIISDVLSPVDFKNKKKISGFISSVFEDYVYLFTLEDQVIDYIKLFEDYEEALQNYEVFKID